ncbi:MAG: cobalamin B12-binding domain-containing protein [Candidatus Lindowbacteria bacterium]|nr:cobalamin B12-binding domain-containing protein [Candidatus Lindowbacteria bacterium]
MKIALISTYDDVTSPSVRLLSSYVKSKGHKVKLLFLLMNEKAGQVAQFDRSCSAAALNQIVDQCRDCDLVGVSLMTNFFGKAVHVTRQLKESIKAPVVWGGIHPTVSPEECLEYADIVCVGEGEQAMVELISKMEAGHSPVDTPNLWFRTPEGVIKNPSTHLISDLDGLPFPDYEFHDDYAWDIDSDRFVSLDAALLEKVARRAPHVHNAFSYQTLTSRGCPYHCSYCCNNALMAIYSGKMDRRVLKKIQI